jgi:hypothetical protein
LYLYVWCLCKSVLDMGVNMKCPFCKTCELYDEDSVVCNETGGMYYEDGTSPAGCFRKLEEQNVKN